MASNTNPKKDLDLLNFHIENSPLAFIEWDEEFKIKRWSAKAQKLFEYSWDEVRGLNPLMLHFLDPGSRNMVKQKMDQLISGKYPSNMLETNIQTKKGTVRNIELYNSAYHDADGKLVSVMSFILDITQRKHTEVKVRKNEALFSQLFKNSPIGIARLDSKDCVVDINDSFIKLFGYSRKEARGKPINDLIVAPELRDDAQQISDTVYSGSSLQRETVRIRKDGTEVPVLVAGVPVNIGNEIIAIYGMYVDMTEQKKAERKMQQSLKEKDTLLSEIHHRVKNNLAVISGLLELQVEQSKLEEVRTALRESQSRIMSMAVVHERLYQSESLSKLESNDFVNKLVQTVSEAHDMSAKKIAIKTDVDSFSLQVTEAIPIGLILNELMVNAYKHAFPKKENGRISISFKKEGRQVTMAVRDNGVGLSSEPDLENPKTMGMILIQTLTRQLDGKLKMYNNEGLTAELKIEIE